MKKYLLLLVSIIIFTSGCTNVDTTLNINDDKTATVVSKINFNNKSNDANSYVEQIIKENYKNFLDESYDVKFSDNEVALYKSVPNIEKKDIDLSKLGFVANSASGNFVEVKKNLFVTSYNVNISYNYKQLITKLNSVNLNKSVKSVMAPEYLQEYADKSEIVSDNSEEIKSDFISNFDDNFGKLNSVTNTDSLADNITFDDNNLNLTFAIRVPSFASFNNADRTDGTLYIWDIRKETPTIIRLQYVVYSSFAITFILLIGIGVLIYIAKRILRHEALKRIDNRN